MKSLLSALVVLALVLVSSAGLAQTKEEVAKAQKEYDDGAAHYIEGDYGRAILSFKRAFDLVENPVFLFNIALSQHKLGKPKQAIDAATKAMEFDSLDPGTRTVAQALVASSSMVLSAPEVAQNITNAAAVAQADTGGSGETGDGVGAGTGIGTTAPPAESQSSFGTLGWTGVALTAVGSGALVWGTVLGVDLQDRYDRYNDPQQSNRAEATELQESIEADRPLALGLLIGGGVVAAVGLTLVILDLGDSGESVSAVVAPGTDGANVAIRGEF